MNVCSSWSKLTGMPEPNFVDKTIWTGDNLDILRGLNSESVDLIYLDPPFNSNRNYAAPVGSRAAGAAFKDAWTLSDLDTAWMGLIADEQPAMYKAIEAAGVTHGKGMQSYLCMMAVRLLEMRRALKDTGSIYLHCDPTAGHYLKMLMDSIFDHRNFRNEIHWYYYNKMHDRRKKLFPAATDTILFYVKNDNATFSFNQLTEPRDKPVRQLKRKKVDGRMVNARDADGNLMYQTKTDRTIDNVWRIPALQPASKERTGYPTQKPLALLERIIKASSNPGDMVLDPFCGCATACVAAEKLGREWVGIDISSKAVELVNMRLREFMGDLFHERLVTARTDIPRRTDIAVPIPYRKQKHVLFGEQEGKCAGCKILFPFPNLTIDHVVPRARGGTDHLENLQLLCGACNSIKGDREMAYLMARLKEREG